MQSDAMTILAARLASGEIGEEEYDRIRARLNTVEAPVPPVTSSEPVSGIEVPSSIKEGEDSRRKAFLLLRLWRGELSLPVTYWLWGGVGGLIIGFVYYISMSIATTAIEAVIPAAILIGWMILIAVAIFRSGAAYQRRHPKRWWGRIAQGVACLGLLANLGNVARSFPGNESEFDLDKIVAEANQSGPHSVGDNVRFDRVTRQGRTFIYTFTINGATHIPSAADVASARTQMVKETCSNRDVRRLLLSIDQVRYYYVTDSGQQLMTYDIARGDCV